LTDGSIVFTPDLFGPASPSTRRLPDDEHRRRHQVSRAVARGGVLPRWLTDFTGINTASIAPITDNGYQVQSSAMVVQKTLSCTLSGSQILRPLTATRPSCARGGNWYFTNSVACE
jgi:hypothetical protein